MAMKVTTWVQEKPVDLFPEIEKTWVMEVRNNENVTRYTTYTAPTGTVALVHAEENRRGKWKTFTWRVFEAYNGYMDDCVFETTTRRDAARVAMNTEKRVVENQKIREEV